MPRRMTVSTESERGITVVTITGDLDAASAPQAERALDVPGPLLADLCGVDFIDSFGLRVLLQRHRRAEKEQDRFALVCPRDSALQRLLELVGTAGVFDLRNTREEGLQALAP